jgi:hypothetical protein
VPALLAQPAATSKAPRTAWGAPDLRGVWNGTTITPLERPPSQTKEILTEAEARALEAAAATRNETDAPPAAGDPGTYNQVWFDPGSRWVPSLRTSLVTDQKDGRIPFTDAGRERFRESNAHGRGRRAIWTDFDTGGGASPTAWWAHRLQQQLSAPTEAALVIVGGDRRVVGPTRPTIRGWAPRLAGGSDTLVVETAGFADKTTTGDQRVAASRPTLKLEQVHARGRRDHRLPVHDGDRRCSRPWTLRIRVVEPGEARRDGGPTLRVPVTRELCPTP